MKKNDVKVGGLYRAKVSDKLVTVRIDSPHSASGWHATNTATGKRIRIKSAQRLRGSVKTDAKEASKAAAREAAATAKVEERNDRGKDRVPRSELTLEEADKLEKVRAAKAKKARSKKTGGEQKAKRLSALDAAAQVLKSARKPMNARELIAAMAEQNLWKSPGGATPHATLYAAMQREERDKGTASRFRKVDRGLFAFNASR